MMEPLERLPASRLEAVEGLVFDVDDTVTRGGRLEPEALGAMHAMVEAGLALVAVTGRPLGWVDVMARHWPIALGVGENGAGWSWVDGAGFHEGYLEGPERRAEQAALLDAVRDAASRRFPGLEVADDQRARRCDLAFDVGERAHLPPEDVDALVALIEEHGARSMVSSVHCHAIPGEWDKARGVVRACEMVLGRDLDESRGRWLFVGDSGNDAAAFAHFPLSVGVANVVDHAARLPTPPRFVTRTDRGRGFAELAERLLAARI